MQTRRVTILALIVLTSINILNFYDRQAPGTLAEPIRHAFDLNDTQLGLLGSAFIWIYALAGLPIGWLGDRYSRRLLLAFGVAIWSALTALNAIAGDFTLLLISRMGVGIGEAVAAPLGTAWISDLFPPVQRARAQSLFMLGVPIGTALSYFTSGPIAGVWGWRVAMALAAAPALVLLPALFLLPEPKRGAAESPAPTQDRSMAQILRMPVFWWIVASGAFLNFEMYAIGTFMPAYLGRIHHMPIAQVGIALGVCQVVGGIGGALLAGRWGDRIVGGGNRRLRLAGIIILSGAPAFFLAFRFSEGHLLWVLALFLYAYGTLNAYYGLVYAAMHDFIPHSLRATAMALYLSLMYACGGSLGPILTGKLSDHLARGFAQAAGSSVMTEAFRAAGLQEAMLVIPILSVALALVLWAGSIRRQSQTS
jgi:MFS family permease